MTLAASFGEVAAPLIIVGVCAAGVTAVTVYRRVRAGRRPEPG